MKKIPVITTIAVSTALLVSSVHAAQFTSTHPSAAPRIAVKRLSSGETFTHQKSGVQFDLPDGWTAEPDGEQLAISSADETFSVVFWVAEEGEFAAAVESLDEELSKTIKNLKMSGDGKEGTHNGMAYFSANGTGEVEDVEVLWSVDLLKANKPVIILTFAAKENFAKNIGAYKKLVASIRKIK